MSSRLWHEVDSYITDTLVQPDAALAAALEASDAAGLPQISVSPAHGKLLWMLARLQNARRILEIGTLGGYSTIWLARALSPGGRLVTLEADPNYAKVAYANIARAGLSSLVEIRVGRANRITGPYRDRKGLDLKAGGGSVFLATEGRFIGPGHAGVFRQGTSEFLSYHFYDGNREGQSALAIRRLQWNADGWPSAGEFVTSKD